jgi:hypothetical protein
MEENIRKEEVKDGPTLLKDDREVAILEESCLREGLKPILEVFQLTEENQCT